LRPLLQAKTRNEEENKRTEVVLIVTPTFAPGVLLALGAVLEYGVFVSNVREEMQFVFWREESCSNAMDGRVAPSLWERKRRVKTEKRSGPGLIVYTS